MKTLTPTRFYSVADKYQGSFIFNDPDASSGATLLYLALYGLAGQKDHCWPSQSKLASMCKCSQRTVQKYLRQLIHLEYIQVEKHGSQNVYRLLLTLRVQRIIDSAGMKIQPKGEPSASSSYTQKTASTGEDFSPRYKNKERRIKTPIPPNLPTSPGGVDVFSRSAPREILLEFERFFAAWPVQQDKKACSSVYARLKSTGRLPSLETLLSSVTHMKSKDRRWIAGFVPNLKFWLLGERWNDSPYQAVPRSTENAMSSAEKPVTADSAQVMQHYKSTSSPSHYSKELEDTVSIAHALWPTITRGRIFASFGLAKCKGLSLAMLSKQLTSYKKSLEAHPASIPFGEWLEACYAN